MSDIFGAEVLLRLALWSRSPAVLSAEIASWLAQAAADAGATLPQELGKSSYRTDLGSAELYRLPDRLLASVLAPDQMQLGRTTTTEIDLRSDGEFDIRVSIEEPADAPFAPRRTPGFVDRIIADPRNEVTDIAPLRNVPHFIGADAVAELVTLVDHPERKLPVVVVSVPSPADPFELARRLAGAAHVLCLDPDGSLGLTHAVGRWHSVFHGGVRTYPPGFTWKSSARQAPLSLAARLGDVRDGLPWSERLVRAILATTSGTYRNRPFSTVQDFERQEHLAREESGTLIDSVAKLGNEVATLRAQRDGLRAELEERNLLIRELSAVVDQLRRERRATRTATKAEI